MTALHHDQPVRIDKALGFGIAKVKITHADLTAAAANETLDWDTLVASLPKGSSVPANARIMWAWGNLLEEFAGGSAGTAVVDLGDDGIADELMSAINVFTGAGTGLFAMDGAYSLGAAIEATAYNAKIKITITGDTVDNLTAGELELFIYYQEINSDALL